MKKWLKGLGLLLLLLVLVGAVGASTVDRWLFRVMDPGEFQRAATPKAPDYGKLSSWAAHPSRKDGSDVALPSHPAIDPKQAPADVFYIHPTTWMAGSWNAAIEGPEVRKATRRGGTLIQASAFNGCCAVYGPRYRQAHGKAFILPNSHGDKAIEIAYSDVRRAFRYFAKRAPKGRPWILATHSQGTFHGLRLLREEIAGKALQKKLVAAYLLAGPVPREGLPLPICAEARQTGCIVAWNSRGPKYEGVRLEFPNPRSKEQPMRGLLCVNPLSWKADGAPAPAKLHKGALFLDAPQPKLIPRFANGRCSKGRLLITQMKKPYRDGISKILDWIMGPQNYHPFEYQLFYMNIRANAGARVQAFLRASK